MPTVVMDEATDIARRSSATEAIASVAEIIVSAADMAASAAETIVFAAETTRGEGGNNSEMPVASGLAHFIMKAAAAVAAGAASG